MTRLCAIVGLLSLLLLPAGASAQGTSPAVSPPPGLPAHFGLGLAAHPDQSGLYGWMPEAGVPWAYAYQYLAGGVNTGNGWATWNTAGRFVTSYAQGAAALGAIPVFPYYMLLQSNGQCGACGEAQRDLAHLNDPAVMERYFADFELLMKRLGTETHDGIAGFGRPAIVHVEPDLSGYAMQAARNPARCYGFCTGTGNSPAFVRAAVARSGHPAAHGLPDTYQGFNWALLRLRDRYAPNVLLAVHVSSWATGMDVGSSSDARLDVVRLGEETGQFTRMSGAAVVEGAPAGLSTYDLVFNDVLDRDAGFYALVLRDRSRWWDRLNVTLPNFHRREQHVGAINRVTGKPMLVWQVPLGNQVFRTMDNTDGHYQDNRAEYFLEHIDELRAVGIVGLLFGRGNGGSTTNTDDKKDGVTNPQPVCTRDGVSSGQVCAERESVHPDDDGGYLRLAAQRYYAAGPVPLTPALSAGPAAPAVSLTAGSGEAPPDGGPSG